MRFLISYARYVERRKRRYKVSGIVPRELCIGSADLSRHATRFWKVFVFTVQHPTWREKKAVRYVLRRLGRYTVLLEGAESMSPTIIAYVEARGVKYPWGRVPIVANCYSYPVRLDIQKLQAGKHNLNLSILATSSKRGDPLQQQALGGFCIPCFGLPVLEETIS